MIITRAQARALTGYAVDDALNQRRLDEIPTPDDDVRYVGFYAGAEPMFVAVWSYLPETTVGDDDAMELAQGLLHELKWFADGLLDNPTHLL